MSFVLKFLQFLFSISIVAFLQKTKFRDNKNKDIQYPSCFDIFYFYIRFRAVRVSPLSYSDDFCLQFKFGKYQSLLISSGHGRGCMILPPANLKLQREKNKSSQDYFKKRLNMLLFKGEKNIWCIIEKRRYMFLNTPRFSVRLDQKANIAATLELHKPFFAALTEFEIVLAVLLRLTRFAPYRPIPTNATLKAYRYTTSVSS